MCSETATAINHCHPGTHTHTHNYDDLRFFFFVFHTNAEINTWMFWCIREGDKLVSFLCVVSVKDGESSIHLKTLPLNERSDKAGSTSRFWLQTNRQTVTHTHTQKNKTISIRTHSHTGLHTHTVQDAPAFKMLFKVAEIEVACSHMRERHMTSGEDLHLRGIKVWRHSLTYKHFQRSFFF